MKKRILYFLFAAVLGTAGANAQWKPVSGKIASPWSEKINPENPLPEYPRPQLTRENNWKNLNGLWQYTILPKAAADQLPASYEGSILVPYAVESSLSGVGKTVGKDSVLWYNRIIDIPSSMRKGRLLLHFGAVDWAAQIYINGVQVATHEGGYDPFSVDITKALKKGAKQSVAVRVWDPTDEGPQPAGKQVKNPHGIWYTPVTGIWQTVWLEHVPETYITSVKHTPDIDKQELAVSVVTEQLQPGDQIRVSVWDGASQVATQTGTDGNTIRLPVPNAKLWSPQHPFLYDLKIAVLRKGKVIDQAGSYFGMRKSSVAKDKNGIFRMLLNNEFVFQYGPLDQGWWPDGLYTAPTDAALKFDIEQTRALGFNMIRKHIKVEPARWYYYCDKLGVLVWQDMPSGDRGGNVWDQYPGFISGLPLDKERTAASEAIHKKEWKAIMDHLHNYPSIVCWVPFNEAWGQFKTKEIVEWTMAYDPSRLVNAASGGNYVKGLPGHIMDLHRYPAPMMPDPDIYGDKQALVLGEFGGLGLPVEGHTWVSSGNWGYQSFKDQTALYDKYEEFINRLPDLIKRGLSAAVYTQTTDVEVETNGLYTYDRKVLKYPLERMFRLHQQLYDKKLVP
ncbi:glycoside hydrolase family 2 protein [Niabella beijingensis]|uniref:glycoside hydrolase family 2 protein n=1 Tax=Niabella beijingensis TaxID=2872700 RepID=UPI001CBAA3CF|nr:sugar-binding domain-containing protein [Niabella beijingensis]MBZ4191289.1 beta-galactosidase [Niabella beijingensis]